VLNAVTDALLPFGVSLDEFPATPQRIRERCARPEEPPDYAT
jgi:hypothetical protein